MKIASCGEFKASSECRHSAHRLHKFLKQLKEVKLNYKLLSTLIIPALFAGFLIAGCSKDDDDNNNDQNNQSGVLVSLEMGNWWLAAYEYNIPGFTYQDTFECRVEEQVNISGDMYYLISNFGYCRNGADGLYVFGELGDPISLWYKYPASAGDEYIALGDVENEDYLVQVLSTNTVVTTPAGTFSCYRYKITGVEGSIHEDYLSYVYGSPNVGFIKRYTESDISTEESELIDYSIGGTISAIAN